RDGHDGTWVAHPGLIETARQAFAEVTRAPNQLDRLREDVSVTAEQLIEPPTGRRSEQGLRLNVRVAIQYLHAWLHGNGCVPIEHLMEDAATAEISRAQLWQWRKHGAALDDGRIVDDALIRQVVAEESRTLDAPRATELFLELVLADELAPFLTSHCYEHLITQVS